MFCLYLSWLFSQDIISLSEASKAVVAPGRRVVILCVCVSLAVGKVRELALCLRTPCVVQRAAREGPRAWHPALFM